MSNRRSHRPRKSINYSKLSSDKDDVDRDDDDFIKETPSKKRKERLKPECKSQDTDSDKDKTAQSQSERKARNRLSEEEKYNKQLEKALKLSVIDAAKIVDSEKSSDEGKGHTSEQDTSISQHTVCVPLTVHVEVMDSPSTKLIRKMETSKANRKHNFFPNCMRNGAVLTSSDKIIPAPTQDVTTKTLTSRRARAATMKQDDDDYHLSEESESNEDDDDDDETFEDFQDTVPVKSKKRAPPVKSTAIKENKITSKSKAIPKNVVNSQTSTATPSSRKMPSDIRNKCDKTPPTASPMTPRSNNVLSMKSPSLLQKKFIQRGWTPPGPAGQKSSMLKSSQSPGCIRVGLSRNARISPLHPRTIIR